MNGVPRPALIFAVAMLVLPVAGASVRAAETAPADIPIDAVMDAIAKNGTHAFAEAEADIAIARARLDGARSGLMPRLGLSATGKYYETTVKANRADDDREIFGTLELVQPIYDFGQTYGQIRSKRAQLAAAEARALEARHTVMMEGLALYYDLHASELRLRALFEDHASAYVTWERAKERYDIGQLSQIDVARDLADVERTRLAYYEERARNGDYRVRLADLSGLVFGEELVSPPKPPADKPADVDLDAVTASAVEKNPGVIVLAREMEAVRAEREGTWPLPKLEAFGDINHYSRDLRGRDEWAAGARVSWPIFDGGLKVADRARLAGEEGKLSARLENAKRALRISLRKLVIGRENAYQRVIAARAKLEYSTRMLLQRQRQYEQERVTRLGSAMIDNTTAEADLVQATGIYTIANARLAMALGGSPEMALKADFLNTLTGGKATLQLEQFVPKVGSGFGQDDADKVNRKNPR